MAETRRADLDVSHDTGVMGEATTAAERTTRRARRADDWRMEEAMEEAAAAAGLAMSGVLVVAETDEDRCEVVHEDLERTRADYRATSDENRAATNDFLPGSGGAMWRIYRPTTGTSGRDVRDSSARDISIDAVRSGFFRDEEEEDGY